MDKVNGQDILSSSSLTFPKKLKTNRGRRMKTLEKAIYTFDKLNTASAFSVSVPSGLIIDCLPIFKEILNELKRFEGAVEIKHEQNFIPSNHKLYAVPKESEE